MPISNPANLVIRIRALAALAAAAISPPALSGAAMELMTSEYRQDPPILGTVEIWTDGDLSRLEITSISSSESGGLIYRADRKEMVAIDNVEQEYYVIDQEMMDRMAAQVNEQMRLMQEQLAAMPPEQRALAEQMMQVRLPKQDADAAPASTLKKTGESDTVSGFDCDYYDVIREGRKIRDICITPWDELEEGREVAGAMMSLADFFEDMRKAFAGTGGLQVMDRQQEMFEYMEELNGYPVYSRDYNPAGQLVMESRLKSAGHVDVDPVLFEPPEGYIERQLQ